MATTNEHDIFNFYGMNIDTRHFLKGDILMITGVPLLYLILK